MIVEMERKIIKNVSKKDPQWYLDFRYEKLKREMYQRLFLNQYIIGIKQTLISWINVLNILKLDFQ